MSPGDPALAMPFPAPDEDAVPEYVQALERAADYLPEAQRAQLRRAWAVGAAAHAGQTRKSGEPYITHPVAVAQVLAEQGLDVETLVAAILHDTIEDTPLSRGDIAQQFGETVAELVDGVTKLDKLHFADRQEAAAESFRKMLLAMSRDLRVILIKLADRLHNMRTLGAQSVEARRRIANETLDIYAPIAQRLGMNLIKSELQDLGFRALHPWRHAVIEKRIRSQPLVRREALAKMGVLSDARGLYPRLSARENILYFAALQGMAREEAQARTEALAQMLDCGQLLERRTEGFSQGERMKVALARALVHDPAHIVLDEPTNGLDVVATRALRETLRRLRDEHGKCIVFSTHIMQEVERLCDHVVVVAQGRTVAAGSLDELARMTGETDFEETFVKLAYGAAGAAA